MSTPVPAPADAAQPPRMAPEVSVPVASVPVAELDYANPYALSDPLRRRAAVWMAWLSVLSGLCVAAAGLTMAVEEYFLPVNLLHFAVFGATIALALLAGASLRAIDRPSAGRTTLDLIALAGLAIVGAAPVGYMLTPPITYWASPFHTPGIALAGAAFLMMGLTSVRHVLLYRDLANWCVECNRPALAGSLRWLGNVKAAIESLWLICCGVALLIIAPTSGVQGGSALEGVLVFAALGAFFGLVAYGGIWIWMMVAHVRLAGAFRSGQPRRPPTP